MPTTITIRDESMTGQVLNDFDLEFLTERITVGELIRSRVYEEVRLYNFKTQGHFQGLVQPKEAEVTLNGYKVRKGRQIDFEEQYHKAVEAFRKNGIIILIDGRQAEGLDTEITIRTDTKVSFVKLVPLVGG